MSNGQASLAGYDAGRCFLLVRDCEVARVVVLVVKAASLIEARSGDDCDGTHLWLNPLLAGKHVYYFNASTFITLPSVNVWVHSTIRC